MSTDEHQRKQLLSELKKILSSVDGLESVDPEEYYRFIISLGLIVKLPDFRDDL